MDDTAIKDVPATAKASPDVGIANGAAYEVECLARLLSMHIERADETGEIYPAVRGSLMRLERLASVITMALGEDEEQQGEAYSELYGRERSSEQ